MVAAVRVHKFGGPEVLTYEDIEVPPPGPGVTDLKVGDRVGYVVALGSYAAERNLPADRAVKLPDSISYEQAAGMMLKGMTAQYLLRRTYNVKPGDTILVHA